MGKLVRDKIPEIILASGVTPKTRIMNDEEYLSELDKKLNEEIAEYQADKSIEEIADVLEVIEAICKARGFTKEMILKIKNKKFEERGGFDDKIFWGGNN